MICINCVLFPIAGHDDAQLPECEQIRKRKENKKCARDQISGHSFHLKTICCDSNFISFLRPFFLFSIPHSRHALNRNLCVNLKLSETFFFLCVCPFFMQLRPLSVHEEAVQYLLRNKKLNWQRRQQCADGAQTIQETEGKKIHDERA